MIITAGSTNVSVYVYFVDDVSGTATGEPTTGLLFSDLETGGSASYARQGAARVDLTLITLASASADHADGGFILVDDTNMPGLYRVDFPDLAFASGVQQVIIQMFAASAKNTVMRPLTIDIVDTTATIADAVWDEVLTGGTHNVATSAGRRLRQLEAAFVLHAGTAQAGASNTITLDTGASSIDDFYNHAKVVITENTGIEQERIIVDYVGSTRVATIAPPWITNPDSSSLFEVEPAIAHAETNSKTVRVGLAQDSAAGTITLDASASSTTDFYKNDVVSIDAGTGEGQERIITAYNGSTKVATIEPDWLVNPDTTSEFIIEEALVVADIFAISNSSSAADNLEKSTLQIIPGAAEGTPTDTIIQTDLAETQNDIYIGRVVIFTSGAAKDEATEITDYVGSTGTLTVTALANTPSSTDTFIII